TKKKYGSDSPSFCDPVKRPEVGRMLWWLAQNTILAALLAGIVALICRLACLRPAVRHALWLIVLIKLMTPPLVHWPWPAPDVWRQVQAEPPPTAEKPSGADLPTWQLSEGPPSVEVSRADEPPIEQEMSPEDLIREESGEPIFAVDQPPHPV